VEAKTLMGIDSTFLIAVFILLVVVFVVFQVIRK
jgi:hypothetical protein